MRLENTAASSSFRSDDDGAVGHGLDFRDFGLLKPVQDHDLVHRSVLFKSRLSITSKFTSACLMVIYARPVWPAHFSQFSLVSRQGLSAGIIECAAFVYIPSRVRTST